MGIMGILFHSKWYYAQLDVEKRPVYEVIPVGTAYRSTFLGSGVGTPPTESLLSRVRIHQEKSPYNF